MGAALFRVDKPVDNGSDSVVIRIATRDDFVEKITKDNNNLVVVKFYATWSEPCQYIEKAFQDLASEFKTKAKFYEVDVDSLQKLAQSYGVEALPTFVLMRNGGTVETVVGIDIGALKESIERWWAERVSGIK